jgi:hypothetical protein
MSATNGVDFQYCGCVSGLTKLFFSVICFYIVPCKNLTGKYVFYNVSEDEEDQIGPYNATYILINDGSHPIPVGTMLNGHINTNIRVISYLAADPSDRSTLNVTNNQSMGLCIKWLCVNHIFCRSVYMFYRIIKSILFI